MQNFSKRFLLKVKLPLFITFFWNLKFNQVNSPFLKKDQSAIYKITHQNFCLHTPTIFLLVPSFTQKSTHLHAKYQFSFPKSKIQMMKGVSYQTFDSNLVVGAQCGNLRIFLSLRFHVKSKLACLEVKSAILSLLKTLNLNICEFLHFLMTKINQIHKIRSLRNGKKGSFRTSILSKIDLA